MTPLKHTSIRVTAETVEKLNHIAKLCDCKQSELVDSLIYTDEAELVALVKQRLGAIRDYRAKEKAERLGKKREAKKTLRELAIKAKEDPDSVTKEELLLLLNKA